MRTFQPADHLHSRTFLGLLVAQFLAAFNDQAIHASAMFFAINTDTMNERDAIARMPILFYAPWAIFSTIAGYCADRFSKRVSLVSWKFAEIAITLFALLGFWLGRNGHPAIGAYIVLSTVFLMGMHSAFFVPAKYGAMPEILTPRMLSRGNGILESLSFLAVILGTVAGGAMSAYFRGQEYMIGIILTVLAILGAVASLFIETIPTANPHRSFPPYIYKPLFDNIRQLLSSRPLIFAVIGIAFFTFLVAYMRAVIYMHGQSQLPPWAEDKTSYIVGAVALGIGLGSPLVGWLSGGKVEVGLVPIGAIGMMLTTSVAALALENVPLLVVCIVMIGFFTGFYLVPLFSLLQHRAPKTSKGDAIATSNFINITGAIASSLIFSGLDRTAERTGFARALRQEGETIVGTLEQVKNEHGHPVRVVVATEEAVQELVARDKEPASTALKLAPEVVLEDQVAVYKFLGKDRVTYHVVPRDAQEPEPEKGLRRQEEIGVGSLQDVQWEGSKPKQVTVLLSGELFLAKAQGPDYVLLRLTQGLALEGEIAVRKYVEGRVTYYRFQLADSPERPIYNKARLPMLLFFGAGGLTLVTLCLLWYFLPDLFRRVGLWWHNFRTSRLEVGGMLRLPGNGPAIVLTDAATPEQCAVVVSATDRTTTFLPPLADEENDIHRLTQARKLLARGGVVGVSLTHTDTNSRLLWMEIATEADAPILPVHYARLEHPGEKKPRVYVIAGSLLAPGTPEEVVLEEFAHLRTYLQGRIERGEPLEQESAH